MEWTRLELKEELERKIDKSDSILLYVIFVGLESSKTH